MTEPNTNLAEIRNLPIPELVEKLPALSADQLRELHVLESAADDPRKGALAAIDEALTKLTPVSGDGAPNPGTDKKAATRARSANKAEDADGEAAAPAWQAQDYSGPLDIEQATWRARHIKPVRSAETK